MQLKDLIVIVSCKYILRDLPFPRAKIESIFGNGTSNQVINQLCVCFSFAHRIDMKSGLVSGQSKIGIDYNVEF